MSYKSVKEEVSCKSVTQECHVGCCNYVEPARKAVLQSLLTALLKRFLTPWHQPMEIPHDACFRTILLPIVADSDAHTSHCLRISIFGCDGGTGSVYSRPLWSRQEPCSCNFDPGSHGAGQRAQTSIPTDM